MHGKQPPAVYFAEPPELEELCTVILFLKNNNQTVKYNSQVIKCRELIFTEPDIIAAPAVNADKCIHLIMQQSLYKTGRLQARFQKINLEASKPTRVTPALYQSCLKYTIIAKIAPTWNKAGEWFVEGRNFITTKGYLNAVNMDLTVNSDEVFVVLDGTAMKLPPLQISDLDISLPVLQHFHSNPRSKIDEYSIAGSWCYVLPSMKRGKVVAVLHDLPQDSPFKSYRDLKRHWKNMYGYRLPETDENIYYYQVYFRPIGNTLFTYPSFCIRSMDFQRIPRIDFKPIVTSFLQDLQQKVPSVCNSPLRFRPEAKFTTTNLHDVAQLSLSPNVMNLSSTSSISSIPYRDVQQLRPTFRNTQSSDNQVVPASQQRTPYSNPAAMPRPPIPGTVNSHQQTHSTKVTQPFNQQGGHNKNPPLSQSFDTSSLPQNERLPIQSKKAVTDAIVIAPSNLSSNVNATPVSSLSSSNPSFELGHRVVPIFKPKKFKPPQLSQPSSSGGRQILSFTSKQASGPQKTAPKCGTESTVRTDNVVRNAAANVPHSPEDLPSQNPTFKNTHPKTPLSKTYLKPPKLPSQHYIPNGIRNPAGVIVQSPCTPQGRHVIHHNGIRNPAGGPIVQSPRTPQGRHVIHHNGIRNPAGGPIVQSPLTPQGRHVIHHNGINSSTVKRKSLDDNADLQEKKAKKPQIHENVDVTKLAQMKQLSNVNAPTLMAWLRERGITCKAREKKQELVDKVNNLLQLSVPED